MAVLYFKVRARNSREKTEENHHKFIKRTGDLALIILNLFTGILQIQQLTECFIDKSRLSLCPKN